MFFCIRHNKLIKPFDDYNKLCFNDLINLSNQTINPKISDLFIENNLITILKSKKIDLVYTSQINRTQETAKLLWYNKFIILKELNEIFFDINMLISEADYKKYWLIIVREKLWENLFLRENWVEDILKITKRLDKIISLLESNSDKNILIISHWFLLILLKLRINKIDLLTLKLEDFQKLKIFPINYLDWFFWSDKTIL